MALAGNLQFFQKWIGLIRPQRLQIDFKVLMKACMHGNVVLFHFLLSLSELETDNRKKMHSCLEAAATFGHVDLVKYLLKNGLCDPSLKFGSAAILASKNGFASIVEILVDSEMFLQSADARLILCAALARTNDPKVKAVLLKRGAIGDPNHVAVHRNSMEDAATSWSGHFVD